MENRNVYKGHRYVPKIMGVWDQLKTYEGLSIVTLEGTSYTSKKRVPEGVEITNEDYWVVTGNYNAQVENYRQDVREFDNRISETESGIEKNSEQLEQKVYYANDIDQLKSLEVKVGGYVKTSGYWNAQDKGGADYTIVDDSTLVDDGGSIITLSNGLKAVLLNDGVDCAMFGASKSKELPEEEVNTIFDNWTNYVNNTAGKHFAVKDQSYHIYKPLYIRKNFIGEGQPIFYYREEGIGKTVSSEKTSDGKFSFNVEAVMGVNPQTSSDTYDRFTLKNFSLYCTLGDDDTSPSQEIGLYFPQGNSFKLDNIVVVRADESGFVFKENWMGRMSRLNSWKSRGTGFEMVGTFTSLTFENNYAHGFKHRGFNINGAVYSTFSDLGADSSIGKANTCYAIASCYGSNFNNLGTENCEVDHVLYVGDLTGNISGVYIDAPTIHDSVITFYKDSNSTIENITLKFGKRATGKEVNSFKVQTIGTGENYHLDIKNLSSSFQLGDYTATRFVSISKGRVSFNTSDDAEIFQNNIIGNRNELIENRSITGGVAKRYSDGTLEVRQLVTLTDLPVTSEVGNTFRSEKQTWESPVDIVAIDNVSIDVRASDRYFWGVVTSNTATSFDYYVMSPTSTTWQTRVIINVTGRWK